MLHLVLEERAVLGGESTEDEDLKKFEGICVLDLYAQGWNWQDVAIITNGQYMDDISDFDESEMEMGDERVACVCVLLLDTIPCSYWLDTCWIYAACFFALDLIRKVERIGCDLLSCCFALFSSTLLYYFSFVLHDSSSRPRLGLSNRGLLQLHCLMTCSHLRGPAHVE